MRALFVLLLAGLPALTVFSQKGDSLRIISYNIHHAAPPSTPGVIDVDAIVALLKKHPSDVVALQEVDVLTNRSGKRNQAKLLADALGMHVFFARAIDHDGGEYGVAVLSKFPLRDTGVIRLPMDTSKKSEQRVLGTATVSLPSGSAVTIGFTHLDHQRDPKNREMQMNAIKQFAAATNTPFVLAGDLNAEPGAVAIQMLDETFQRSCDPCPPTYPAENPKKTIDFIAFKKSNKITIVSHTVLAEPYASDHAPVRAVLYFQ